MTLGAAAAVLVVVVGAALALNQNPTETHVAGPAPQTVTTHQDSTDPSTNGGADGWPIPAQQAADACPDSPAPTPHQVPGASGPLVDIDPVEAIVCVYAVDGQREGSVLADPVNLGRISAGLASLEPVPVDQACTDEMGPIVALILTDAERTEVVWLQFYGCGAAFSGDQVRTGAKALSWLVP